MNDAQALRRRMVELMRGGIRTLEDNSAPDKPYFTGYSYGRLYDWDQYFEAILQLYGGFEHTYIRNAIILFLENQAPDGHVVRSLPKAFWFRDMVKPFLAQMTLLLVKAGDDLAWFTPELFWRMKCYLQHWLYEHDVRKAGLSVWDNSGSTGMDNQHERAGSFFDNYCEGVDLNSYLVRECEAFARLCDHLRKTMGGECDREAAAFRKKAQQRREAINRWCWHDGDGLYYDYHALESRPIPVKHVGIFAALWANVANAGQARRLTEEHILNPAEFWRSWPLPALAASEPGYAEGLLDSDVKGGCSWRAHTWIPTNYYTFHGLVSYGYRDAAQKLAQKTAELFRRNPFREYYATESGAGWGLDPFWGWSGLALYMEEEFEQQRDPTALV
jgi:putative isomerase